MAPICKILIVLTTVALGACTSLPDTGNYTAATIAAQQATASVGDVVAAEIDYAAEALPSGDDNRTTLTAKSEEFRTSWATTENSLAAMVRYAESIEDIVPAGDDGKASVTAVTEAVEQFAGELGVPVGSTVTGVFADIRLELVCSNDPTRGTAHVGFAFFPAFHAARPCIAGSY